MGKTLNINGEFFKTIILKNLHKLIMAIRIEKKCSIKEANKEAIKFLKDMADILEKE